MDYNDSSMMNDEWDRLFELMTDAIAAIQELQIELQEVVKKKETLNRVLYNAGLADLITPSQAVEEILLEAKHWELFETLKDTSDDFFVVNKKWGEHFLGDKDT